MAARPEDLVRAILTARKTAAKSSIAETSLWKKYVAKGQLIVEKAYAYATNAEVFSVKYIEPSLNTR